MKKMLFFLALSLFVLNVGDAFAVTSTIGSASGSGGTMQVVLCNVLKFVTGGIGKTLAAFVIIGVGLGFFSGKVSWGLMIGVTLGISAIFGAPAIIAAVTGSSGTGGGGSWCK
jgi:type IV secretory pathway VirB2 component (pilin)